MGTELQPNQRPLPAGVPLKQNQQNGSGYIWSKEELHVVYQGQDLDGHVRELWWDGDWHHNDLTTKYNAPRTISPPFGFETKYDHTQRIVYLGRQNQIYQLYNPGGGWHLESVGAVPSSDGRGPTAYAFEDAQTAHVLYRTGTGHILDYHVLPTGWQPATDLTVETGAPLAQFGGSGAAVGYVYEGLATQHVVYVAANQVNSSQGNIIELVWDDTTGWLQTQQTPPYNDLTGNLGIIGAQLDSTPACYAFEGSPSVPGATQHIFFVGTDGYVHALKWDGISGFRGWTDDTDFDTACAPRSFYDVVAFVDVEEGTQNVFYTSDDHDIIYVQWTP